MRCVFPKWGPVASLGLLCGLQEHQNDHLFHFNIISVTTEVQVIGRLCDFISKYRSDILERDLEDKTIDLRRWASILAHNVQVFSSEFGPLGHAHQRVSDLVPEKTWGVLGRLWGSSACAPQKITGVEPHTAAYADPMSDRRRWKGVQDAGYNSSIPAEQRDGDARRRGVLTCHRLTLFFPTWSLRALSADATCLSSHPSL